ncbi:MAG: murein biosynthesis integral membrane protein MurJ [Chloroflexota bacterium]
MTVGGSLARAGLIVSGAFLIARVLGYVRVLVIANAFEPTQLDPFFAAFRIPDLIFQLVAAGALSSALIPIVSGLFTTGEQPRAWRVVSTVINLMLIALLVLAIGLFLLAPDVVRVITPGFEGAKLERTIELTRIMLLSPIFLSMGAVATSVLNAGGRFAASAIAPIIYNLAIVGGALILGPAFGVEGLAVSVVLGSLGHLLVQVRPLARLGFRYTPRIDAADPEARQALLLMAPRAIGLGVTQITFIVVTALASLLPEGAVSDFNFAFALLQIPLGIIGVPLGIVVLPSLSREAAVGREDAFASLLTRALRLLVYVMVPISILTAVVREPVVEILFGGGKLRQSDLDLIAVTLVAFIIGLTAHALIAVLARGFYARQDTVTPVAAAVGAVVVNSTLAVILVGPFGLPGIALAIAIAAWLEAAVLLAILHRRVPHFELRGLGRVAVEAIAGGVVAGVVGLVVLGGVASVLGGAPGRLLSAVEVAIVSLAFGAVYAAVSLALRIPELPSIVGVMADVLRRPARS